MKDVFTPFLASLSGFNASQRDNGNPNADLSLAAHGGLPDVAAPAPAPVQLSFATQSLFPSDLDSDSFPTPANENDAMNLMNVAAAAHAQPTHHHHRREHRHEEESHRDYHDPAVHAGDDDEYPYHRQHRNTDNHKDAHVRPETRTKLADKETCPDPAVVSCSAQAQSGDVSACCVVKPGGVLVHTQFWDIDYGQPDSWGIHGLWPDTCSNAYWENCDKSRKYSASQIEGWIQQAGGGLYEYMTKYWVSDDDTPSEFWAHEWATHGTCVSTLEPDCFDDYSQGQEVAPYFETVVNLFKQLDTYEALAAANILPGDGTYELTQLQKAIENYPSIKLIPDFICEKGVLSSVQYYLNAQGPLQDGQFSASTPSRKSSCPSSGIEYPQKDLEDSNTKSALQSTSTSTEKGKRRGRRVEL